MKKRSKLEKEKAKLQKLQKEFLTVSNSFLGKIPWKEINYPEFPKDIAKLVKDSTTGTVVNIVYLIITVSVEVLKLHRLTCDKNNPEDVKKYNSLIDEGINIIKDYVMFG